MIEFLKNSEFVIRWKNFFSVLLNPYFIVFALLSGGSVYLSIQYKTEVLLSNLMTISGSVFGGIAGAFFADDYLKRTGNTLLDKKGRSALRNLQSINTQLCNVKKWIADFVKKTKRNEDKRILEEVSRHITTIELNIASGLEDWTDIVPELKEKIKKEEDLNNQYSEMLRLYVSELFEKRRELVVSSDEAKTKELKRRINELEKEIDSIKKERYDSTYSPYQPTILSSGISGSVTGNWINNSSVFHSPNGIAVGVCRNCGDILDFDTSISAYSNNLCQKCLIK